MKRLIPTSLLDFWGNNANAIQADLFSIALSNGVTFYVTDAQFDITVLASTPGWAGAQTTFRASATGLWFRGEITSEAGTECRSNTMDLTFYGNGIAFPGSDLSIYAAARNQLFDAATVRVFTAYMPVGRFGDVTAGIETKAIFEITKAEPMRGKIEFQTADPLYLTNLKVPSRLMQSNCPWGFCDSNCGLTASDYTTTYTEGGAALTQPDGYYEQGVITALTGANAGFSLTVKSYVAGVITTVGGWLLPVIAGDTFSVIKGCDKTITTCRTTTKISGAVVDNTQGGGNGGNGSTPFIPPASVSI
jgi:hypothetical protein